VVIVSAARGEPAGVLASDLDRVIAEPNPLQNRQTRAVVVVRMGHSRGAESEDLSAVIEPVMEALPEPVHFR
jgi:hypothetical protein